MAYKRKTPPYKWVIIIYAVANEKVSDKAMPKFLNELEKIGKKLDAQGKHPKVKIFLLVHRNLAPRKKQKRYYTAGYELQNNFQKHPLWFGVVNENMGDSETLSEFMLKCDETLSFSYPNSTIWLAQPIRTNISNFLLLCFIQALRLLEISFTVNASSLGFEGRSLNNSLCSAMSRKTFKSFLPPPKKISSS